MAVKTIQIADKPTLDATKALLEDSEVGLAAIKQAASSGAVSGSAGGLQIEKYVDEQVNGCVSVSTLPFSFSWDAVVVFNDEIHILSGTNHYKYNGSSWESVSTLPYSFSYSAAVVFNGEIHILGGSTNKTKHYKYNGTSWVNVSTLPYNFYGGSVVVYDNKIHILGSNDSTSGHTKHYKLNGTSWVSVSTLPCDLAYNSAVVYNGEIHILSGTNHYKYNGSSWESVSTLPCSPSYNSAVVYNDEIHILRGTNHYKYNGSSWGSVSTLPYNFDGGSVVFNGEIHILGGKENGTAHYVVKNDNRHIATMLPKGAHILLSGNEDINYVSNAIRITSNIAEVAETGYVELLATLPDLADTAKGYLTFY